MKEAEGALRKLSKHSAAAVVKPERFPALGHVYYIALQVNFFTASIKNTGEHNFLTDQSTARLLAKFFTCQIMAKGIFSKLAYQMQTLDVMRFAMPSIHDSVSMQSRKKIDAQNGREFP